MPNKESSQTRLTAQLRPHAVRFITPRKDLSKNVWSEQRHGLKRYLNNLEEMQNRIEKKKF